MATSDKKKAANRKNGQKSHGPKNTNSSRFNATKHGLLAIGLTELDDHDLYGATLNSLIQENPPVGVVETQLVESLALEFIRLRRARRLEAEYITAELNPPIRTPGLLEEDPTLFEGELLDPGKPAAIGPESMQRLSGLYQRYESAILLRIFRLLHELERLQRMRNGETLPAPTALDVNIHADALPAGVNTSHSSTLDVSRSSGVEVENADPVNSIGEGDSLVRDPSIIEETSTTTVETMLPGETSLD